MLTFSENVLYKSEVFGQVFTDIQGKYINIFHSDKTLRCISSVRGSTGTVSVEHPSNLSPPIPFQESCDKVYISTSDVQMHANYHRKDSAIQQEGFQRFRASEDCGVELCSYQGQRTTHFHCKRPGCSFTFKNKADMGESGRESRSWLLDGRLMTPVLKCILLVSLVQVNRFWVIMIECT